MKLNQIILLSVVAFMLLSCSSKTVNVNPSPISTPDIGIPVGDKYLVITTPQGWNTFKINRPVDLMVFDISDQQIVFNENSDIRAFVWAVNKWVEVKNKMSYTRNAITLVPDANRDLAKMEGTAILPDLTDYPGSSKIRIYIIGKLENADQIASYIDVTLNP